MQARFNSSKVSGPVIGIDLGTTNSCVAIMEGKVSFIYQAAAVSVKAAAETLDAFFRLPLTFG